MTADIIDEPIARADLIDALRNLNARAMTISRRGYVGIQSPEYKRRHDDINLILDELDHAPA